MYVWAEHTCANTSAYMHIHMYIYAYRHEHLCDQKAVRKSKSTHVVFYIHTHIVT